jgi:hypothetical protein
MAQTQTVTDTGIAEWVILMSDASSPAATAANKIVCLNMATPCTAVVGSTFADPADTATHHTDGGLQIAVVATMGQTQTNTAGDTITFDHVFTASETRNVAGIHLCNNDGDVTFVECCFNAVIAMESSDTLTIDGAVVINQA